MATAAVEEKCVCGAEFALSLEVEPEEMPASLIFAALDTWRKVHPHRSKRRRAFGLLAAVSRDTMDGEGADEWQGMYASPAEGDDDD